jgi:hypothetical protein
VALAGALKSYQASLAIRWKLAEAALTNSPWQRDLSISDLTIGYTFCTQADLAGTLKNRQADLAITQSLAQSNPANATWHRPDQHGRHTSGTEGPRRRLEVLPGGPRHLPKGSPRQAPPSAMAHAGVRNASAVLERDV